MQIEERAGRAPGLRRGLNIWEAIGISVALMAPSMAANINPQGTAASVGRAVPLAFALATVGVLLVAYTFVRLCQHYHHAGSVYGFVGATLGARTGLVAGWALLGTYTFYGVVTSMATGIFGTSFLDEIGVWNNPPTWAPFLIGALALGGVFLLTISPVRNMPVTSRRSVPTFSRGSTDARGNFTVRSGIPSPFPSVAMTWAV